VLKQRGIFSFLVELIQKAELMISSIFKWVRNFNKSTHTLYLDQRKWTKIKTKDSISPAARSGT
jgi:hypothetical protein